MASHRRAPTILQQTPPHDSQSNGRVERAVRSIEEQTRVLKLDVENRIGGRISVHDAIFIWLLRHATMLLNFRQPSADGKTAYQRLRGRSYQGELMRFACHVLAKISNTVSGGLMQPRWQNGLWLGKAYSTDEHIVWLLDGSGILQARTVQGRDETLTREHLQSVTNGVAGRRARIAEPEQHPAPPNQPQRSNVRRWQITREIFTEYGATPGCGKCSDWAQNLRTQRGHSQACRARLERILRANPYFAPRILESEARAASRDLRQEPDDEHDPDRVHEADPANPSTRS